MTQRPTPIQPRIPAATYRLQFNRHFTLRQAAALVDYLRDLGVSDCYASPLLMARPGSLHGYDVVDPTKLNPEVGTEEEFGAFARRLKENDMGLVMDVVPNHMCIAGSANRWWNDVLENGPGSPYAKFFDIDWNPPKANLADKVLLPVLGDQYGRVLENQEVKLNYQRGAFFAQHYETRLPIAPRASAYVIERILQSVKAQLEEYHPHVLELESILTALSHLPPRTETGEEKVRERRREKEIIKRRLSALAEASPEVRRAIKEAVREFNGVRGVPQSFDWLEELLSNQAYRLSFWRVAADEINYRRFFDINELAAVRVEEPAVFSAVHDLIFRFMRRGWVTGLRVDHVDGLFDPEQYLRQLQRGSLSALIQAQKNAGTLPLKRVSSRKSGEVGRPCYVVVEKVLGPDESLPRNWAVHGTTGYDFMNLLNGVFVEQSNGRTFRKLYKRFTGYAHHFDHLAYGSKKLILRVAMSSELHMLARKLDRVSEQHRYSRDFTLNSLQYALGEVIACFPVYRSYIHRHQAEVSAEDRSHIASAIRAAKRRNPATSPSIFDFIGSLLLLEDPDGLDEAQRAERRDFVMRFQQLTGPVTAKGIEDTACYRSFPLASLNEVGGDPARFGISLEHFHRENGRRLEHWPHTLSATSTHDTKRGEDVRARISVLSEIPRQWYRAIRHWQNLNRDKKAQLEGREVPDANEEYLLYQTLVGAWPLGLDQGERRKEQGESSSGFPHPLSSFAFRPSPEFVRRIQEYMIKAIKEAKLHSSWISPNEEYERAVRDFVEATLAPGEGNQFLNDFLEFQAPVSRAGMFNSLSQTLLKIASPGVPDFYQGTEVWDFSLVDPDNRRPVDYERRQALLASLRAEGEDNPGALVGRILTEPGDGRLKLHLTRRALAFRRDHRQLFTEGAYLPLSAAGEREHHVIAFARMFEGKATIVVAGRFFARLGATSQFPVGRDVWGDSVVVIGEDLAKGSYRDVLTGNRVCIHRRQDGYEMPLAEIFARLPVALLEQNV